MLFAWTNATVFQAGPSIAMNWYDTNGAGGQAAAGNRTGDGDAMCGNAVMYDATAGKILVVGGSINYVYLPRYLKCTEPSTHLSTAKRQRDNKRPHHHTRHPNDRSHRPNHPLNVLPSNLRQRRRPPHRRRPHHRRPRLRRPLLRQRQPARPGTLGPHHRHLHASRAHEHPQKLPLHRAPPPGRHRPIRRRRPVWSLRDKPLRRTDLQP